jgi:hypothetical protein
MPTVLSDPSPTLYLVLAVACVVTGAMWFRSRKRSHLIAFMVAAGLLALLFLSDLLFDSPREEAERRVKDVVAAVNARDYERAMSHFSAGFEYSGLGKGNFMSSHLRDIISRENVRVAVWDFSRGDVQQEGDNQVTIGFMSKGESNFGQFAAYARTTFVRDADGHFRMKSVKIYGDPLKRANGPEITIPGLR